MPALKNRFSILNVSVENHRGSRILARGVKWKRSSSRVCKTGLRFLDIKINTSLDRAIIFDARVYIFAHATNAAVTLICRWWPRMALNITCYRSGMKFHLSRIILCISRPPSRNSHRRTRPPTDSSLSLRAAYGSLREALRAPSRCFLWL